MDNKMDELKIQQVIHRFANSFDIKDWRGLEECFAERIYTDYSDLRGTLPETIEAKHYIHMRQEALRKLKTHHLCGNHEIEIKGDKAVCKTSMVIYRSSQSKQENFTTHCLYTFSLQKINSVWKITSIIQKVFWNDGDASIHSGAKQKS